MRAGWWIFVSPIVGAIGLALVLYFRSFRRWNQSPPTTPEQIQAEMRLDAKSRQPDR
ncbi:MAG: hypothetical protein L0206_14435 [Actinobacteria bacterium]|nr:hypothetical protein [Actinomycetota bacterium]